MHEILSDQVGEEIWLRFRFLAPAIARDGGAVGYERAVDDMAALCGHYAIDYIATRALVPDKIVISLGDRRVPFGTPDPDATQFIEVFRLENGRCVWEAF